MPTLAQIQHYAEIFAACAVSVGLLGTGIESLGTAVKSTKIVALGRVLEDFAANVPRLLGVEKPRA